MNSQNFFLVIPVVKEPERLNTKLLLALFAAMKKFRQRLDLDLHNAKLASHDIVAPYQGDSAGIYFGVAGEEVRQQTYEKIHCANVPAARARSILSELGYLRTGRRVAFDISKLALDGPTWEGVQLDIVQPWDSTVSLADR
jgi:hypothetical protein